MEELEIKRFRFEDQFKNEPFEESAKQRDFERGVRNALAEIDLRMSEVAGYKPHSMDARGYVEFIIPASAQTFFDIVTMQACEHHGIIMT